MSWVRVGVACLVSLLLHLSVLAVLRSFATLPDVGFEISLPAEVELGVTGGMSEPVLPPAASQVTEAPSPAPAQDDVVVVKPKEKHKRNEEKSKHKPDAAQEDGDRPDAGADAGVDAATDAGTVAGRDAAARERADAGSVAADAKDAGARGATNTTSPKLAAFAPEGAQLSLRLDMREVRKSIYVELAREVLAAIPDFRMLLDGSQIDPVDDISRLFLASPNLERSKLVMAGQYEGGEAAARVAVERLASARGKRARWQKKAGIAVAPWENLDTTQRVVALIGPSQFAITRPEDLPRVLGVARALSQRAAKERNSGAADDAEALLAMQPGELLAFSVENAKAFVRGRTRGVPERATLSISALEGGVMLVRSEGVYASGSDANSAREFWDELRGRYARHPLVALAGMAGPLRDATLDAKDERLLVTLRLGPDQVRFILQFLRDSLAPPAMPSVPSQAPIAPSPMQQPASPAAPSR